MTSRQRGSFTRVTKPVSIQFRREQSYNRNEDRRVRGGSERIRSKQSCSPVGTSIRIIACSFSRYDLVDRSRHHLFLCGFDDLRNTTVCGHRGVTAHRSQSNFHVLRRFHPRSVAKFLSVIDGPGVRIYRGKLPRIFCE